MEIFDEIANHSHDR